MSGIFDVEKFNIINDENNYYFFRALNRADSKDIDEKTIIDEAGKFIRIRTDRERWEENLENVPPKYEASAEIDLMQVYDHIKMHYRKDTNCISLSSNANVSVTYGRGSYNDRYVMVKVPKAEMGQNVINAGQYMLEEIEKRVNETIASTEIQDEILEKINKIDNAISSNELKEIIAQKYTSETGIDITKTSLKKGITYKAPTSRISNYQSLSEEQTLEKNKIIAKLTVLERSGTMMPIIPHSASNTKLIETVGNAFSSCEQIHYGEIESEKIIEIQKELVDIFALLQQVEGQNEQTLYELKNEVIKFVNEGNYVEIPEESILKREDKVKENITIEEMYQLTQGKVEYGIANSIVKKIFYLTKSQSRARELAEILNQITKNNPKYQEIIAHIENNCFEIEPQIIHRHTNEGYKLSESVNLDLQRNELGLVEEIRRLNKAEQIEILENGGLSDVQKIITREFGNVQEETEIVRERYYAEAIVSSYNWKEIGIEEFTVRQKNELLQKLQEKDCIQLYNKLKDAGIQENQIPVCILNIASKEKFNEIINAENYKELIQENLQELNQKLSIEQIEDFLEYYAIEGTKIKLRDYQSNAVKKANKIYEDKRFASVVLPTGAGKSFVAMAELLEHKDEPILYLAPQNEILEQIKNYIIEYIHGDKGTIGKTKDQIIKEVFPNIKFETYTGLLAKRGKDVIKENYGFIVFDELHRTGAEEWETKIDRLIEKQSESTKVLGITATPTRDVDNRDMARENALKLGYTEEEVKARKHIAMDMNLIDAIKLGLVVNPKLVSCEYSLKADGSMDELLEKINSITDDNIREERLEQYRRLDEKLRRNLENADGIPEILQKNIKQGGKYLIFIPVTKNGEELEDEDGNKIGRKTGQDKIEEYRKRVEEYLKDSGLDIDFYSMIGSYGDKKNEEQLQGFENDNSEKTKFMIVMNKANEGLHIKGLNGMIWFRALDENSRILYLQQLGRIIYSEDPNNPTPEEDRPVVIDLPNNTMRVDLEKELKTNNRLDDLELLTIVVDWAIEHGRLPEIDSTSSKEQKYAGTLYRIQNEYVKYLDGFEQFKDLEEEKIEQIKSILYKGSEIELWDTELPPRPESVINNAIKVDGFEVSEILRDFVELDRASEYNSNAVEKFIEMLEKLQGIGIDTSKIQQRDTIQTIAEKSGITKEDLIKIGLNPLKKIGNTKSWISYVYRGRAKGIPPTLEQVERLKELGIDLEKIERNIAEELIETLEKLQGIGVDVTKLQQKDTIQILAEKSGVKEEKIIKVGLNPSENIGSKKSNIALAYRGKGGGSIPPTPEQVKRLKELGISLEKIEKNVADEFIKILKQLQEIGVEVAKLQQNDTIQTLAEKSGVKEDELIKEGLNPSENIGIKKSNLAQAYRGKGSGTAPTPEQVKTLKELGISLEKTERNVAEEFIEILKKLQKIGVDVTKLQQKDTIQTLAEKSEIDKAELIKIGLNPDKNIGTIKVHLNTAYRGGKGRYTPLTAEQVESIKEFGISLEKIERNVAEEFIETLERLKKIGVDISNLTKRDTIKTLAKKSGINEDELIKEGLISEQKIGLAKQSIANAYRGIGRSTPPTAEQVEKLNELGINLEKIERNVAEEFIETLEKLQEIGVDVTKLQPKDTIQTLAEKSEIKEDELKKIGLNPEKTIGRTKLGIADAYRGKGTNIPPTPEQVEKIKKLGVSLEKKEKNMIEEFIEILEQLQKIGVQVSTLKGTDSIQTLAERSGINKGEIEKIGLNLDRKIGYTKKDIQRLYSGGKRRGTPPTPEQVEKIKELGINLEKKTKTGQEIGQATFDASVEKCDEMQEVLDTLIENVKEGGVTQSE